MYPTVINNDYISACQLPEEYKATGKFFESTDLVTKDKGMGL